MSSFSREWSEVLDPIVTDDEMQIHYVQPETKAQSKQ